jgi:hypothetical protein
MRYLNEQVISSASVSTNQFSSAIPANNLYRVSVQAVTTGSPAAGLMLQMSNDTINGSGNNIGSTVPTNWTTLGNSVAMNSASSFIIASTEVCAQYLRVVVVGGGSGSVSVNLQGQGY